MLKKRELLLFTQDRLAMSLLLLMAVGALALIVMTILNVRVSDVQVPVRYSGYGFTNIYRDRWFVLIGFAIFPLLVLGVNGYLALKLRPENRNIAIGILGVSVLIIALAVVVSGAVFRLAAFSL